MDKKALIKALRDTVQSASNSVASGVSAPVDLIAAGLRKVGLPIPQAPVGGSQWMENIGLTVPVEDGIPKLAGETLGMIVPMAATAKAPQIAAAANRGLENLAAPRTLNTPGYGGQRGAVYVGDKLTANIDDALNNQPMGLMGTPKQTGLQELTTLNPTGSVFSNYDPISRAIAPLGKNITTLDKTMGGLADDTVTIYRGAPKTQKTINPGDFITTDAQLARVYAGTGHVISQKVRKKDILDDMLEPLGGEYIYRPAK